MLKVGECHILSPLLHFVEDLFGFLCLNLGLFVGCCPCPQSRVRIRGVAQWTLLCGEWHSLRWALKGSALVNTGVAVRGLLGGSV
jgi:hypothetical protein